MSMILFGSIKESRVRNRDGSGNIKTIDYGGTLRKYESGQNQNYAIMNNKEVQDALGIIGRGYLQSKVLSSAILGEVAKRGVTSIPQNQIDSLKKILSEKTKKVKSKKSEEKENADVEASEEDEDTEQEGMVDKDVGTVLKISQSEFEFLVETMIDCVKNKKIFQKEFEKNIKNVPIDLGIALVGRMDASGFFPTIEGAYYKSSAISTHKVRNNYDDFTTIDDFTKNTGAGFLGSESNCIAIMNYNSMININSLKKNNVDFNNETISNFIVSSMLVTSDSGNRRQFANNLPSFLYVVKSEYQPITVNCFDRPITPSKDGVNDGYLRPSIARFLNSFANIYVRDNYFSNKYKHCIYVNPDFKDVDYHRCNVVNDINSFKDWLIKN